MEGECSEQNEWRKKYDPRNLSVGTVAPEGFVDLDNDDEYFLFLRGRVQLFEAHMDERLPEDFRKYLNYCGHLFYNFSYCGIGLTAWNENEGNDEIPFCQWCSQPLANTKCTSILYFDGKNKDDVCQPGLIRFSNEGCGYFKFIVIKGPLKGSIWSANPGYDGPYLSRDEKTFKEILDNIFFIIPKI